MSEDESGAGRRVRFDSLVLSWVIGEANAALAGARVKAVEQAGRFHFVLRLQASRAWDLYVSSHPRRACLWVAPGHGRGAQEPHPLLTSHLRDARLRALVQHGFDRVVFVRFERPGTEARSLVGELISGGSNLVLLGAEEQVLWVANRNMRGETGGRLAVGGRYSPPAPKAAKDLAVALAPEEVAQAVAGSDDAGRVLSGLRQGLSPTLVVEALGQLGLGPGEARRLASDAAVLGAFNRLLGALPSAAPGREAVERYLQGVAPAGILAPTPGAGTPGAASAAVAAVFLREQEAEAGAQARARLCAMLSASLERAHHTLRQRQDELKEAGRAQEWRRAGEMLLAQPDKAPLGTKRATLEDLYTPGASIGVELDPSLSPYANAARHFDRARRAESAARQLPSLIARVERECVILEGALQEAKSVATPQELAALREQLQAKGLVRERAVVRKAKARVGLKGVRRFPDIRGYEVLVGTDARGNETVLRMAESDDLWFHSRGAKGGHAVIRTGRRPEAVAREVVEAVATLAAHFSDQKHSELVPVDYTQRKFVRRAKGAGPGHVLYERAKTLFVRPAEALRLLERLSGSEPLAE